MRKRFSKVLCAFLTAALCFGTLRVPARASSAAFTDVPAGSWYYDAVTSCAEKGYVSGVGNNQFMPTGQLTYAQVFTMLANAFFKDEKQAYEASRQPEMDAYFDGTLEWWSCGAYYFMDTGLLEGTAVNIKSAASANSPITRYDTVQIAANILASKSISVSSAGKTAAQAQISDWASVPGGYQDAVASCFSLGIISGYADGRFAGTDPLTRAQACIILNSLVDAAAKGGSTSSGSTTVEKPSVTAKDIEITTKVTQYGTGYYVGDNGFGDGYLNNGKPITEENVLELLEEAQKIWPEGTSWAYSGTYSNHWYQSSGNVIDRLLLNQYNQSTNYSCGGLTAMLSDYLFGKTANPFHRVYDPMDIRAGDIIIMKNADGSVRHVSFAATSTIQSGNYVGRIWTVDGGGTNGKIAWPDYQYSFPTSEAFAAQFNPGRTWEVWSRYPA